MERTSSMLKMECEEPMLSSKDEEKSKKKGRWMKARPILRWLKENVVLVLTSFGILMGLVIGILGRYAHPSEEATMYMSFPGDLFMGMLKMVIVPLLISSLVSGLAQVTSRASGKMGLIVLGYYLLTTVIAMITGTALVILIHPGNPSIKRISDEEAEKPEYETTSGDAIMDLFRNLFPDNIVRACFQSTRTVYTIKEVYSRTMLDSNETFNETGFFNGSNVTLTRKLIRETIYEDGMNILGVILFSIAFGIALSKLGDEGRLVVRFFSVVNDVVGKIVEVIMWYAPIGICCLIAGKFWSLENMEETFRQLGLLILTVMLGLLIHLFVTMQLLFFAFTRRNPFTFFRGMMDAFLITLGHSSSTASLPVTFRCLEERNHVDKRVSRFVCPVGATINVDGAALLEAVCVIFIAQMNGISLDAGRVITIMLTATLASMGSSSIPSSGLVLVMMVMGSLGLPSDDIPLLFTIDWFLDRIRTAMCVLGDSYCAGVVDHFMKKDLAMVSNSAHSVNKLEIVDIPDAQDRKSDVASVHDSSPV